MTTTAQVRQTLHPLLDRNPDLALVGRLLVIRQVHHIVRGIFVDRGSMKEEFVPGTYVSLMYLGQGIFRFEDFNRLNGN